MITILFIEGDLHLNGKFIIEGGVNSDMDISSKHNIIGNQLVSTTETEPPLYYLEDHL